MGKAGMNPSNLEKRILRTVKKTKYRDLAPYILAMAKHETANFDRARSLPYDQNNNIFGMGRPSTRDTTDNKRDALNPLIVEGQAMASYDSIEDSVEDVILWMEQFNTSPFPTKVKTTYDFARQLKGIRANGQRMPGRISYFTDTVENYSGGLARWM